MSTVTVNVSFPKQLLRTMDAVAKQEARSRSELLREATRVYVERKRRWEQALAFGRQHAKRLRLKPQDIETLVTEYRRGRARNS